jgi:hypothetical protein
MTWCLINYGPGLTTLLEEKICDENLYRQDSLVFNIVRNACNDFKWIFQNKSLIRSYTYCCRLP